MLNLTRLMLEGLAKHHDCHKTRAFDELREEADMVMATGLAELTDTQGEWTPQAVMDALKWSQVLECMETCLEHISDLGEIIEGAVLKYV